METTSPQLPFELNFCRRWWRMHKRMIEPYSAEQGKALHETSQPYTVVLGKIEHPHCFIEVGEYPGLVVFLDQSKRCYLSYNFKRLGEAELFLDQTTEREYKGDSEDPFRETIVQFTETGKATVYKVDSNWKTTEKRELTADVSDHFVSIPKLGEYAEMIRKRPLVVV